MLYKLGTGELRLDTPEGKKFLFVDGGFAQMVENRLTLLTEQARRLEEIDSATVKRAFAEARALPKGSEPALRALKRATVQRNMLAKRRPDDAHR
jgi:F-type H+-transporting ATPase subunit epsilon